MQSLFECKTKMPYDLDVFENMKATAFDLLCNTKKKNTHKQLSDILQQGIA